MKFLFAVLLSLLLCGCTESAPTPPPETAPETTAAAVTAGLYDPDHPIENAYPGEVRAYPMNLRKVHGILVLGNDVLALSGYGSTSLTVFTGEELREATSLTVDFSLEQDDPSLRIHASGISYFDPHAQETVLLDHRLREIRRIAIPDGISGKPILSSDAQTLYYCTAWSVMAWDLESGIRRTVKELSYENQELTALHLNDQILECSIRDHGQTIKLLLSADHGMELGALPEEAALFTGESHYFVVQGSGYQTLMLFGEAEAQPELLLPDGVWQQQFYLPEDHAAVTVTSCHTGNQLNYYELNTGILLSSLTLEELQTPKSMASTNGHFVYILAYDPAADCDILYRWDVPQQTPDPAIATAYTAEYHNPENPDPEAREACREYAKAIGQKYGITVRVLEEAVTVQPWDYRFEAEHLAPVLQKELRLLEQRLARYPEGLLQKSQEHFTGLTICLVREITGTGESDGLTSATGIQFFEDKEAYVVITTGKHSEQALYHELYHVMETHLLTESTALDRWDTLNPAGFVYGDNQSESEIYLQGQTRAFVDRYSMLSQKENRARVLENAMLPDNGEVFQSEYMQRKLNALCTGLREAYRLKQHPEILPWEQYLVTPLAPTE